MEWSVFLSTLLSGIISFSVAWLTLWRKEKNDKKNTKNQLKTKLLFFITNLTDFRDEVFKVVSKNRNEEYDYKNKSILQDSEHRLNLEELILLKDILIYKELNNSSTVENIKDAFKNEVHKNSMNNKNKDSIILCDEKANLIKTFLELPIINKKVVIDQEKIISNLKVFKNLLEDSATEFYILSIKEINVLYQTKNLIELIMNKINNKNYNIDSDFIMFLVLINCINELCISEIR
ncbi:hypothetical protein P3U41_14890 [Mammaliicoccus sciuri]|uniref:hypothetical protein n=1 Tax=Mammaliicoccus sciuri TaxID=1296 RepID=UPI000E6A8F64|nr:hypothetical protein [Mammaliicoccus sciuri]MDT0755445.1 hypothetical protein [Mammaliicoccus sciuri]RIN82349.1 hypothetical protein BU004_13720 [Mammaliicoccus sciuri]WQL33181.1 hypothetical protein P3U41_14890 [Mammaliicoccus sciuri]WQL60119.1 hypothetical protein P3T96_14890 [Mammaliicoccus sciuri]